MVKTFFPFLIIILFAVVGGFSLLHKGLPPTHDGEYHVIRFYEFNRALQDGNWYPRWAPDLNNGFGVPLFNYVYPLPNYIASFFHLFGISFIDAFKLEMFFALIIGGIFFYLWSKEFWGVTGGVISSVFYSFSPYHFVDIYIRGSVGEVWALAFFPAFLWSITQFIKVKKKSFFILSPIFFALIIFSHNILALTFIPFAITYLLFIIYTFFDRNKLSIIYPAPNRHLKNHKRSYFKILNKQNILQRINKWCGVYYLLFTIFLGLGLSAIFWLPALFETQYVRGLQIYDIKENFPETYQLLIPSWGSGFLGGDLQNQMSFQIGVANLLAVVLSVFVYFSFARKKDKNASLIVFFLIWFGLAFFLMLKVSLIIWRNVPLMNYFQFPWRLLSLEILIASFLVGSIFKLWSSKLLALLMILFVFLLGIGYARPAYYHYRSDNYYTSRPNFIDGTNSSGNAFNTIWINKKLKREKQKIQFLDGDGEIKINSVKSTSYKFTVLANQDSKVAVNTAYFPGWTVFVDGKEIEIINNDGLINFILVKGDHAVEVVFKEIKIRQLAKSLSFLSLIITFILLFRRRFATIKK